MPINYANGKIYTIRSHQSEQVFVGATTQSLAKRLATMRINFKSHKKGVAIYHTEYKVMEHEDHYIELMELCPCITKIELMKRTGEIIRATENCINKIPDDRPKAEKDKEYREENKEYRNEKAKEYNEVNKDKIKAKRFSRVVCVCGANHAFYETKNHPNSSKQHKKYVEELKQG